MKKFTSAMLAVFMIVSLFAMFALPASAAEIAGQDGIQAGIFTDADAYAAEDEITVQVRVRNTNDFDVNGVSVETVLPEGLIAKNSIMQNAVLDLAAGETDAVTIVAVLAGEEDDKLPEGDDDFDEPGALDPEDPTDPSKPGKPSNPGKPENNKPGKPSKPGKPDNSYDDDGMNDCKPEAPGRHPDTGDDYAVAIWATVLVLAVAVALFALKGNRKALKTMCLMLTCLMLFTMVPMGTFAANDKAFAIEKTVTVDGEDYTISAVVGYDVEEEKTENVTYTVDFDANCEDAENIPEAQEVNKGEFAELPSEPFRTGYNFVGWFTDIEGTDEFDFYGDSIEESIVLYAVWSSVDEVEPSFENDDPDGDRLTNSEENTIGTDPYNYDTDGDGVSDGKEVELNTDPLSAEDTFKVNFVLENINDTVKPMVNIELDGEQVETLIIEPVNDALLFPETIPGYMGQAYDFSVLGDFTSATISFEFDKSMLENADLDPVIYYYNEKEQKFEPLETSVVGNVASAVVEHFSTYILIDRKVYEEAFTWQDIWEESETYTSAEIVLVIDDSGSLGGDSGYNSSSGVFYGGNDPEHKRLEVARTFVDKANFSAKIGIVKFDSSVVDMTNGLVECDNSGKNLLKNKLVLNYNNSNGFDSSGSTLMYGGIEKAISQFSPNAENILKVAIVFTDGIAHDSSKHNSVIDSAIANNVKVYTVGLGVSSYYFEDYLKPLASRTGGAFYSASDADQLADIYENIREKIDINTDSDDDGIPDYYEDNMVAFNGVKYVLDKNNPDTDGDGKLDGEEIVITKTESEDKTKVIVIGKIISDPCKAEVSSKTAKIIKNLENNLTNKKDVLVAMAKVLLEEGYEPSFVAGILANIYSEGTVGLFESSNYKSNAKPQYLAYMDSLYDYRNKYSGKLIYNGISLSELKTVMDKIKSDGYKKGKFGLGCVQWTGGRTYNLFELYLQEAGSSDTITKEQAYKVEALMISKELKGPYKYVYNSWKTSISDINSADAAYEAGSIICKKYEVPYKYNEKAPVRANKAKEIYSIMMK